MLPCFNNNIYIDINVNNFNPPHGRNNVLKHHNEDCLVITAIHETKQILNFGHVFICHRKCTQPVPHVGDPIVNNIIR